MSEVKQQNEPTKTPETKKPGAVRSAMTDITSRMGILGELLQFLWARKLWWLIPMLLALAIFAILIIFASATGAAPFIYTLF